MKHLDLFEIFRVYWWINRKQRIWIHIIPSSSDISAEKRTSDKIKLHKLFVMVVFEVKTFSSIGMKDEMSHIPTTRIKPVIDACLKSVFYEQYWIMIKGNCHKDFFQANPTTTTAAHTVNVVTSIIWKLQVSCLAPRVMSSKVICLFFSP